MRTRNKIFAEAFKWIKAHRDNEGKGVKYQKDLAALVGVSEDTITRIMHDQTEVTDDFLCKFNEAFDNVFNYQWLRGEDNEPRLAAELGKSNPQQSAQAVMNLHRKSSVTSVWSTPLSHQAMLRSLRKMNLLHRKTTKSRDSSANSATKTNSSSPCVSSCYNSSNYNVSNPHFRLISIPQALPTIKKYNNNTILI